MRKKLVLPLLFLCAIAVGVKMSLSEKSKAKVLRIGLSNPWNTIHPGLQHTLVGDLVLSNQFEALVGYDDNGTLIPLGASSWEFSEDFRRFTFHIDRTRTFPDGSHLSAVDFKRSWEDAARLTPISANKSTLDVLYKIDGFNELERTGHISGLQALSEDSLQIQFTSPFRMALEHLSGNRFAAHKKVGAHFVGTGAFEIRELGQHHIEMIPREKGPNAPTLDVRYYPVADIIKKLLSGDLDAAHYLTGNVAGLDQLQTSKLNSMIGQDSLHLAVALNTTPASIFSNRNHRLALQYLIRQAANQSRNLLPPKGYFDLDPQFYLPLQAGRLDLHEVDQLIRLGAPFVEELKAASKKKPIRIFTGTANRGTLEFFKSVGLTISADSSTLEPKEYLALIYGDKGPDAVIQSFSIASGDPDGIYHILGLHGAIRSKYVFSAQTDALLETGRRIVAIDQLDEFYKGVSRSILEDVPMVHIGFAKALLVYRNEAVEIDKSVLRRNQGQLHFLRAK